MAEILQFPPRSKVLLPMTSTSDESHLWNERLVDESKSLIVQSTRYRENTAWFLEQLAATERAVSTVEDRATRSSLQSILEVKRNCLHLLYRRLDLEIVKLDRVSSEIEHDNSTRTHRSE